MTNRPAGWFNGHGRTETEANPDPDPDPDPDTSPPSWWRLILGATLFGLLGGSIYAVMSPRYAGHLAAQVLMGGVSILSLTLLFMLESKGAFLKVLFGLLSLAFLAVLVWLFV